MPGYSQSLVSLLDILGFRNLVANASVNEILLVLMQKEQLSLKQYWPSSKGRRRKYVETTGTETFSFSDLIVNVSPLKGEYPVGILFERFRSLGFSQFRLACNGIFLRGGVTIGDIYAEKQTVFGPALIKAYDLERETAKWPIIAIDPLTVTYIECECATFLQKREVEANEDLVFAKLFVHDLTQMICRTTEGVPFLDYIAVFAYEDSATGDLHYYLEKHKNAVIDAFDKYRHWKYKFVAQYHDAKCKQYFPKSPELMIGPLN